ncbi:MAG: sigma-70 family RNA polymerase sigma factor [Hyphomicrobiaceae bacterium]|nr:sigma-70 family RNA polymerase sigma factor [Hyphomicrobiaceae bacterium]
MRTALARPGDPPLASGEPPAEDAKALARLAGGDALGLRDIVDRHLPAVLGIARRMLREESEAEDVAQETMLRLWRNASRIELGPGGLRPWLRRVVSNLCIDRVRAGRHLTVVEEVPEQAEPASQLDSLERQHLTDRVAQALQRLPDRQRLALTLFHFEGLSQSEVGATLGISDDAVESLLARGRRALKAALEDEWRELLPDGEGSV